MSHRFFLPPQSISAALVQFPAETTHQIIRVLRLRSGELVTVLDGSGVEFDVRLIVAEHTVTGEVVAQRVSLSEPHTHLTLYLCLTQRDKFEWMLQKCTEVGAASFVPVISSRSLVQKSGEVENKRARWEKILQEAAEQSGRGRVPQLEAAMRFKHAVEAAGGRHDLKLIPWENADSLSPQRVLKTRTPRDVGVLIGPEGGFSEEEVAEASQHGFLPVTLGPRILRMETAAVVSAALVLAFLGDME